MRALKESRKLEDLVVQRLNERIPTKSFDADPSEACKEIHQMVRAHAHATLTPGPRLLHQR